MAMDYITITLQDAKRAAKKAKQKERDRRRKAEDAERKPQAEAGVSAAELAEDEVARAALEAAQIASQCAPRPTLICALSLQSLLLLLSIKLVLLLKLPMSTEGTCHQCAGAGAEALHNSQVQSK
jgi:hypothetical protein